MEIYHLLIPVLFLLMFISWRVFRQPLAKEGSDAQQIIILNERLSARDHELQRLLEELSTAKAELQVMHQTLAEQKSDLARAVTLLEQERLQHQREIRVLDDARTIMKQEFALLASEVLEQKGKVFGEQHEIQLKQVLQPLGEKLQSFEAKIEQTHLQQSQQRSVLEHELKRLMELNTRISDEADSLTKALKGENKTQGNWGEFILERLLESSGLAKGREYDIQSAQRDNEGALQYPDVIVNLPEGKQIIIDSKVSLTSYLAFSNSDEKEQRELYLKAHIQSIRAHIQNLSGKKYQNLPKINTLDFVLLFVNVEPAFLLALQHDDKLFTDAFSKNIILVGPSTLLATLRTIQSLWRFEYQNKNANEIAKIAGSLYDQFVAFTKDLDEANKQLERSQNALDSARKRLFTGNGNVVKRIKDLRKLGAKTSKELAIEWSIEEDQDEQFADILESEYVDQNTPETTDPAQE